jgi:PAS domain S-box-containing protein
MIARWKDQLGRDTAVNQARIRRFDGEYHWFYFAGEKFTDASGNVRWFGVSLDIEDLKRAEDALRASEAALQKSERRLHQIISTIPGLAWSANTDGEATFINQHYLDYVGMRLDSALGTGWVSALHPDDIRHLLASWQSMMESGRGGDVEARLRRYDGQYRRFLFRTNPLYDDAGALTQWFGVNTDIEDRKRAEEDLRESQAELAHMTRMTTMGELTVSIAHEVNQPLMAIVTNAGTCLRWLDDDQLDVSQARQAAERIVRDGHRAGEIVASIRALAQKSPPKMEAMELENAVREVLELMRGEINRRGVDPVLHFSGQRIGVVGDRTQLQQVILNLIMNSVEAMTESVYDRRRLEIHTSAGGDGFAQVSISDTGAGLDPAIGNRIFDAFFTTKPSGIGMGLSICRSIVEAHGGRIWTSQNTPKGSVFHFTVRLAAGLSTDG